MKTTRKSQWGKQTWPRFELCTYSKIYLSIKRVPCTNLLRQALWRFVKMQRFKYRAFADKVERNCHFPAPGKNCCKLILLFLWSDAWLISGKSCSAWRCHAGAGRWQFRSTLSVNALQNVQNQQVLIARARKMHHTRRKLLQPDWRKWTAIAVLLKWLITGWMTEVQSPSWHWVFSSPPCPHKTHNRRILFAELNRSEHDAAEVESYLHDTYRSWCLGREYIFRLTFKVEKVVKHESTRRCSFKYFADSGQVVCRLALSEENEVAILLQHTCLGGSDLLIRLFLKTLHAWI
jgi:hypothetical protein